MEKIGFIGSGNMAEALIRGITASRLYHPDNILISDIREERLEFLAEKYGVIACRENSEVASRVKVLVLSVKPQQMNEALDSIKDSVSSVRLVISIAAGIKVERIASALGDIAIIRVMPNLPALIDQGVSALFANEKARPMLETGPSIFSCVGTEVVVDDEGLMDAVTAISGTGPAYFFLLMEEMVKVGIEFGLPPDVAKDLVIQTAKGAGLLACEVDKSGETPEILRKKVTSPNGTTEAAMKVFAEGNYGPLIRAAIRKAYERSRELSG
jgi:pyrroline-5-carboxylate reductase